MLDVESCLGMLQSQNFDKVETLAHPYIKVKVKS